jgi:hypothetical protein
MLSTTVFLDTFNQCYKNIIVINLQPEGPLGKIVRKINIPQLSPFNVHGNCSSKRGYNNCVFGLNSLKDFYGKNINNTNCLMCEDEIPDLFSFLMSNCYKIDTSLTKMMNKSDVKINDNKILCFITYTG